MNKREQERPRVRTFIRQFGSNSQAAHVETDQGEYVIKAMNNRDGPPALIAEWVGSRAASWLGVPVPDCTIVELTDAVEVPLDAGGRALAASGPCFGSKLVRAFGWDGDADALKAVENQEAIAGVVVVDTWLRNLDRFCRNDDGSVRFNNPGNLLLMEEGAAKGKFRLVAIDFGYAFGGPGWSAKTLLSINAIKDDTIYGCFPAFRNYMQRSQLTPFLNRLRGLDEATTRRFVEGVPSNWDFTVADADLIVEFLLRRADYVAERLRKMVWTDDTLWLVAEES